MSLVSPDVAKIDLIQTPTPVHKLPNLSQELGIDLWIKRDDLTGFALGGNKGRKLEYLMAEALNQKVDAIVTCGTVQSNFIRQLGAACSMFGLKCGATVMPLPYAQGVQPFEGSLMRSENGNALVDEMLGVDLRMHPNSVWEDLYELSEQLAQEYEAQGLRVYRIPIGGSSPLGAYAFYQAGLELRSQAEPFHWIVCASSSGSTQSGLTFAYHESATKVLGISSDPEPEMVDDFVRLCAGLDRLVHLSKGLKSGDFLFNVDYVGPGYGVPSPEGMEALYKVARTEGIFLDPIYSAKAFAGLLDLVDKGKIGGRVLFWHTGGGPALFAMNGA